MRTRTSEELSLKASWTIRMGGTSSAWASLTTTRTAEKSSPSRHWGSMQQTLPMVLKAA
jgi:hypothetical protein